MRNINNNGFIVTYYSITYNDSTQFTLNTLQVISATNVSLVFTSLAASAKTKALVNGTASFEFFDAIDFSGIPNGTFSNGSYVAYGVYNTNKQLYLTVVGQQNKATVSQKTGTTLTETTFGSASVMPTCQTGFAPNLIFGAYSVLTGATPYWLMSRRTVNDTTKP